MFDFRTVWDAALTFEEFVNASTEHRGLWDGIHATAKLPAWALDAVPAEAGIRLLVIAEDWCGDASNTVPVVAKLAAAAAGLDLRVLRRDEHPAVMDRYLTNGARSIPIVVALDAEYRELGHWGPRPAALQAWVMANKASIPKSELYPQIRRWYARDRGETTLREVLAAAGIVTPPAATDSASEAVA